MNILKKTRFFLWTWILGLLILSACGNEDVSAEDGPTAVTGVGLNIIDTDGNTLITKENNFYQDSLQLRLLYDPTTEFRGGLSSFVETNGTHPLIKAPIFRGGNLFLEEDGFYEVYLDFLAPPSHTDTLRVYYQKYPWWDTFRLHYTGTYLNGDTVSSSIDSLIYDIVR